MISIIIPTYNSEKFLRRTLQSIYSQQYKDFEVIAVDGLSEDGTDKILDEFGVRTIFRNPTGQVDAINLGMEVAKGDVLTYINSDDVYEGECLQRVSDIFSVYSCQWIYGRGRIVDCNDQYSRSWITQFKELWQPRYNYKILSLFDYIVQPTVFFTKQLWKEVGLFDRNLKFAFDYDYLLKMGKKYPPYFIDEYLACWRAHSRSLSVREYRQQVWQAFEIGQEYSNDLVSNFIRWCVSMGVITIYDLMRKNEAN